jgi:hypothetical protein
MCFRVRCRVKRSHICSISISLCSLSMAKARWLCLNRLPGKIQRLCPSSIVLLCHATPRDENEIFTRLTTEEHLLPVFEALNVSAVVCGHRPSAEISVNSTIGPLASLEPAEWIAQMRLTWLGRQPVKSAVRRRFRRRREAPRCFGGLLVFGQSQ